MRELHFKNIVRSYGFDETVNARLFNAFCLVGAKQAIENDEHPAKV